MPRKKKAADVQPVEPKVVDSALEEILADRFSRYSKYIIQERALPDARDGLKPVQRRILWAMEEDGNTYNKPYRKSAKTVGNVIGNYHPHGDTSVYDAIVRMSQDWKSALPLIDMQGNNGSIDDDPAAAMRYTEARLSKIAGYLMQDIDRETVDWSPNFSDEKMEPTVLPARYPNLLINGITGIAAGYATSIPPHNFDEVIQASIYRIDHPDSTTKDLMQYVKGPDFPTGGIIMGKDGIFQALDTGRGKVVIRSKAEIVESKTINQIVITEIPYEVVKINLVKRIDEIRLNAKVSGMLDVRDESDRKGLRIVIDLKKEANAQAILNYLYKNTDLQINYHYNVIAIVNRTPKQLSLGDMLDAFLEHREDVVIKRTRFDLRKKNERMHIVEGLIKALSILDEVIATIRASKGKADSRANIMNKFGFSEAQAEAIVTMQLYRLSSTDVKDLKSEFSRLKKEIRDLEKILKDPNARKELMKAELHELEEEFVMPRRSQLVEEVEDIVINETDMIADEQVVAMISSQGYFKRVPLRSYASSDQNNPALKEGDHLEYVDQISTLDSLLFFTSKGRMGLIPVYLLEEKKWKDLGVHYSSMYKTEVNERICAVYAIHGKPQNTDLIMISKNGQIRRSHFDFATLPSKGRLVSTMGLGVNDELVEVLASGKDDDEILIVTRLGNGVRLETSQIPVAKGKSKGVRALRLQNEDSVLGMGLMDQSDLVIENSQGEFKRIALDQINSYNRPSKGDTLFRIIKSKPVSLEAFQIVSASDLLRFEGMQSEPVAVRLLTRKPLSSGWASAPKLEEPKTLIRPNRKLESGTRKDEEDTADEKPQLSLFDSVE